MCRIVHKQQVTKILPGDCLPVLTDSDAMKLPGLDSVSCQSQQDAVFLSCPSRPAVGIYSALLHLQWKETTFQPPCQLSHCICCCPPVED